MSGNVKQDPTVAELLDIREAAEFLRVSETSLRRWTNAGRLPCLRIGGRRERRFRRSDLLAFVESERGTATQRARNHFCGLYTSDLSRAQAAAAFLSAGVRAGARCLLVARKQVQRAVAGLLPADAAAGLELDEYQTTVTAQVESLRGYLRGAVGDGVARVYMVGDVSAGALGRLPVAGILEYEEEVARSIMPAFPVAILCLYDGRQVSGLDVAELLQRHDGGAHAGYRLEH